ncbi:MAG: hypothetical protein U0230_07220 [Polyangiales bacterium]
MRSRVVLVSALALGCGSSAPAPRTSSGGETGARCEPGAMDVPTDDFVAAGMSVVRRIRLGPGERISVVATGTRGLVDVDLEAYDPDGSLLAADHRPDATPSVLLGGGARGGEAVIVARVVQGAGRLTFAERPLRDEASTAALPVWEPSASGELGRSPLPPEDEFLARTGLVDIRYDGRVSIPSDGDLRLAVGVEVGTCLAVLVSAPVPRTIAVELQSSEGRGLARGRSTEGTAVAAVCAARREEVAIVVEADEATDARIVVREGRAAQVDGLEPLVEASRRGLSPAP